MTETTHAQVLNAPKTMMSWSQTGTDRLLARQIKLLPLEIIFSPATLMVVGREIVMQNIIPSRNHYWYAETLEVTMSSAFGKVTHAFAFRYSDALHAGWVWPLK